MSTNRWRIIKSWNTGWRWTSDKAHGRRNTLCQRWSKLKFHYSCNSGEREITVFKTLDSSTQISVVVRGQAGQGFPIMKILKQPRITASSLILKTFKGTLIPETGTRGSLTPPTPFPSLPKSFRNRNQGQYWKNLKSDNYSTTRIFTMYLNRDLKKLNPGWRKKQSACVVCQFWSPVSSSPGCTQSLLSAAHYTPGKAA